MSRIRQVPARPAPQW